jgi:hypothetical protein
VVSALTKVLNEFRLNKIQYRHNFVQVRFSVSLLFWQNEHYWIHGGAKCRKHPTNGNTLRFQTTIATKDAIYERDDKSGFEEEFLKSPISRDDCWKTTARDFAKSLQGAALRSRLVEPNS